MTIVFTTFFVTYNYNILYSKKHFVLVLKLVLVEIFVLNF